MRRAEQPHSNVPRSLADVFVGETHSGASRAAPARDQWSLAGARPAGSAAVRVFVASVDEHGWSSGGCTVVDIMVEDRPFLVSSIAELMRTGGLGVTTLVHPQILATRKFGGELTRAEILPPGLSTAALGDREHREAWIHVVLDTRLDAQGSRDLEHAIHRVLRDIAEVTDDWRAMRDTTLSIARDIGPAADGLEAATAEAIELLTWLTADNFTFVGYRRYTIDDSAGAPEMRAVPGSGLGILRDTRLVADATMNAIAADVARRADDPVLLVTKADAISTVRRAAYLDRISIRIIDESGQVRGEHRILGHFSTRAYTDSVLRTPLLERKVHAVISMLEISIDSHDGRAVVDILERLPRDELFAARVSELARICGEMAHALDRTLRCFVRPDDLGRFLSVLVYVPRDAYTTRARRRVQNVLADLAGEGSTVEYSARVTESAFARLHFVVRPAFGTIATPDESALRDQLRQTIRTWEEALVDCLSAGDVPEDQQRSIERWAALVPEGYRERTSPEDGLSDLRRLATLGPGAMALHTRGGAHGNARVTIYRRGPALSLADVLPVFASLGIDVVDEHPAHLRGSDEEGWIYEFGVCNENVATATSARLDDLHEAFLAAWDGAVEIDGFNALVVRAGLTWAQTVTLRAYAKYLRQAGTPHSESFVQSTLLDNCDVTRLLITLFETRFDPGSSLPMEDRRDAAAAVRHRLDAACAAVVGRDAEEVLRAFTSMIEATTRTNAFRHSDDGRPPRQLAFKFDPARLDLLPHPRPRHEVFCYSPQVEGVHLRFGSVARGGLRWSDRREDFRTEVLGLAKAQVVKNVVIVPTGAKGGFFAKQLPDPQLDWQAYLAEGKAAYAAFISSLLDVTDDLRDGRVVPPVDVVRWDEDDVYLVVAADKGTATFSDLANSISTERGFWLGDAFASGGSHGYDHKAMGITARGAWTSAVHHLGRLGIDPAHDEFSCVGIGDMSGDVFGNGMLLSRHVRLVAAFDHRHIFIDPDPDAARTFSERQDLFSHPQSTWEDFSADAISPGGGVFSREAKAIAITPQMRKALAIDAAVEHLTPPQMITTILRSPVDMLWNGGVGTYVKASHESHAAAADRSTDDCRIDASQLRCRCVVEGGNLGFTQDARIEYAQNGGLINTDFLDNSAGVDTSDHEVNIKILLQAALDQGTISIDQRNDILKSLANEVAAHVLAHNEQQNRTLTHEVSDAKSELGQHRLWMQELDRRGVDRALTGMPDDRDVAGREDTGDGLTPPELAVLMALTKIDLMDRLAGSDISADPLFATHARDYFPLAIRDIVDNHIGTHPLQREITLTRLVNDIVETAGLSLFARAALEGTPDPVLLVRSHAAASELLGVSATRMPLDPLARNMLRSRVASIAQWLALHLPSLDAQTMVDRLQLRVSECLSAVPILVRGSARSAYETDLATFISAGVPDNVAHRLAAAGRVTPVVALADLLTADRPATSLVATHLFLAQEIGLGDFTECIDRLPEDEVWTARARASLRDDWESIKLQLTTVVDASMPSLAPEIRVSTWIEGRRSDVDKFRTVTELAASADRPHLAHVVVGVEAARSMVKRSTAVDRSCDL